MATADNAHFHIVLVKAWVQKGDRFLLAQRSQEELQAGGEWALPGGKVDDEVMPDLLQHVLAREVEEEVGLKIAPEMRLIHNASFVRVDGAHVVGLLFLTQWESGEAEPLEDTAAVAWYTLDELRALPNQPKWLTADIDVLERCLRQ